MVMNPSPKHNIEVWGGMECTINRVKNEYFDQLEHSGHWSRNTDIQLFAGLGLKKMRYPVIWEHLKPIKNKPIDWSKVESELLELRSYKIDIIAGLVHHGSGPKYVEMSSDSFAEGLAAYAGEVAAKFPWITYYTPINEPLTTARFCGLYGLWYPHKKSDAHFCRILVNECKATVMAMEAIRVVNPSAKLVQTDDLGKVHCSLGLAYQAEFENQRRWLAYDLLCGMVDNQHLLWHYLIDSGITADELNYFKAHPCPPDIVGINYYLTSERYLDENKDIYPPHTHGTNGKQTYADVEAVRVGSACPCGLLHLATEAWQRYAIPIAVTEVHLHCTREEQMRWLKYVCDVANSLQNNNIPIVAITPWALLGSFGWDKLLTTRRGTYEPGVFDCGGGYPRPTILAAMIKAYSKNQLFSHPVLTIGGWWQRACRVTYGEDKFFPKLKLAGKPLMISGNYAGELAKVCHIRGLNYKIEDANNVTDECDESSILAKIAANSCMEFHAIGQIDLVVSWAGNDLYRSLNKGLDLFIDGESGYWAISADGTSRKQVPNILLTHQNLAS
jgi:dTDP-4-dehydrorhamnose reductase